MAIDASIYSQLKGPDFMGSLQRGMSLGDMINRRRTEVAAQEKQQAINDAFSQNTMQDEQGNTSIDRGGLVGQLMELDPQTAMKVQDRFRMQDQAAAAAEMEQNKFGLQKTNADRTYDLNRKRLMLEQGKFDWERNPNNPKGKQDMGKLTMDLRKERSGLPTTKDTAQVAAAYNKIKNAAKKPSAAGDLSLIFNYMKMLDPGSVVREGEFANAQNAAGVNQRVRNMYNRLISGERLAPEQRQDFINQAKEAYGGQLAVQQQIDEQYKALAEKYGVAPEDIILNFEAQELPAANPNDQMVQFSNGAGGMGLPAANAAPPMQAPVIPGNEIDWAD